MLVKEIGEFGLIKRIAQRIKTDRCVIRGIGDDCAVLEFSKDKYQLFTCDMLVEGVDFFKNTDPFLIGRKALAVSVSDIAACAGIPRYCLVSLGLPPDTSVDFVDRFLKGMLSIAKDYAINITGGDISRAPQISVDVSMLGLVEKRRLLLRSGALKGDIIFVSGSLGGSLSGKHLKFKPRIKEARYLAKNFKVNSMIDISDGLIQDLRHILKASKTGAILYEEMIPLSSQAQGLKSALYDGEDFELLFTVPVLEAGKIISRNRDLFRPIGEIVERKYGLRLLNRNGKELPIKSLGFSHF